MNETHWRRLWRSAALSPETAPASVIARGDAGGPSTFVRAAVSCLVGPASIFAILVLVVNDHILKQMWPSWVTGKLSDVAGLYFFPYLCLLAIYGALWLAQLLDSRRRALDPRLTTAIAIGVFGGTFALFAAVKLSPVTAAPALQLLSALAGEPLTAVLDPTDLVALIVLPVSYLGWRNRVARCALGQRRVGGQALKSFFRRAAHAFIIIAAGLAVAASGPPPSPAIIDLAADDHYPNVLYAIAASDWDLPELYRSIDGGESWQKLGATGARIVIDPARKDVSYTISRRGIARSQYAPPESHLIRPPGIDFPMAAQDVLPAVAVPGWKPDLIFVGGKDAVARSEDGGATWSSSLLPISQSGPVVALASAPSQVGVLFAATRTEFHATRDGGDTWRKVAEFHQPITALAVHPRDPELLIAGGRDGLRRSLDGGRTWQTDRAAPMGEQGVTSLLFVGEQGDTVYAAVPGWGLMRSENAGRSWSEAFRGDVRAVAVTKSRNSKVLFGTGRHGVVYRQRAAIRWPWLEEWELAGGDGLPAGATADLGRVVNLVSWLAALVVAVIGVRLLADRALGGVLERQGWRLPVGLGGFLERHGWHLLMALCSLGSFTAFGGILPVQRGLLVYPALSFAALLVLLMARPSWAAWAALAPFELFPLAQAIVDRPMALVLLPFIASLVPIKLGRPRLARIALIISLLLANLSLWRLFGILASRGG